MGVCRRIPNSQSSSCQHSPQQTSLCNVPQSIELVTAGAVATDSILLPCLPSTHRWRARRVPWPMHCPHALCRRLHGAVGALRCMFGGAFPTPNHPAANTLPQQTSLCNVPQSIELVTAGAVATDSILLPCLPSTRCWRARRVHWPMHCPHALCRRLHGAVGALRCMFGVDARRVRRMRAGPQRVYTLGVSALPEGHGQPTGEGGVPGAEELSLPAACAAQPRCSLRGSKP